MVKDKSGALRGSFLFSCIDPQSLPKISRISQAKSFHKNELIFQEEEAAGGFYVVVRGKVKIYKLSPSGNERILHIVGEGGSFAEAVVFGRLTRYPAFAEALTDTETLFIPKDDFLLLMRSDFSLTLSVLNSMSEKLRYFNRLVEELSLKDAPSRLAEYLLDLAFKKKGDSFSLDVKKVELAGRLGMAPETLSRVFKRFAKQRLLRLERHRITLLEKGKLRVISSGEKF